MRKSGKRACEHVYHRAFPPGNETLLNRVQRWRSRFSNKTERRSMGTPFTGFGNRMAGCCRGEPLVFALPEAMAVASTKAEWESEDLGSR